MNKLKMHTADIMRSNVEKLRTLFPDCVTESTDSNGQLSLKINFDQLKQHLTEVTPDEPKEHYKLSWPGKRESIIAANTPIAKTLRPCQEESVNFSTTRNLYIEGDNLDALKMLQESYLGRIKLIYIDPPYNTGKDFIYKDNFTSNQEGYLLKTNQTNEQGKLQANTESNGRFHSDWLSMIYPRIRLARNLLREDGAIFISIDDSEIHNLKIICNEIFGESNYLGTIVWKKKTNGNNMGHIPPVHDYILCYGRNADNNPIIGFPVTKSYIDSTYSNPDDDPRGPWTTTDLSANHEGPLFEIINPNTGKSYLPAPGRYWVFNEKEVASRIKEGRIIFGKTGNSGPVQKKYLSERTSMRTKPESWWDNHGMNSDGTEEIARLLAPKAFDHSKPTSLLKNILAISTKDDDLILDFFSGSASTAHAVMRINIEDGGNRRYICVQIPERLDESSIAFKTCKFKFITDLGKERIRRAAREMKEQSSSTDLGFRVLRIDTSNMSDVYYTPELTPHAKGTLFTDNIKPDRTSEDLLFQVMLDWGVDLSLPIATETIQGKEVFFVDGNALVACFDAAGGVDEALVKALASREPLRVVFRDAGFRDSAAKINVEQVFKLLSPATDVRCI